MLRRDLLSLGTLLAAAGLASALPDVAAAKAENRPGLLANGVKGTWKGKGNGSGTLTANVLVQSFAVANGSHRLRVQGRIASPGGTGGLAAFVSQPFTAGAKLVPGGSGGKSCGVLTLEIGTIHLSLRGGLAIKLAPIKLDLPSQYHQLDSNLCTLEGLLAGGGSSADIKAVLDQINATLAKSLITIQ